MSIQHTIRVFLASPGDVEDERRAFGEMIEMLSNRSGYRFQSLGFENALASTGKRPQDIINGLIDQCDIFLAVFHRRWGQCSSDTVVYTSYTEEEFERATGALPTPEPLKYSAFLSTLIYYHSPTLVSNLPRYWSSGAAYRNLTRCCTERSRPLPNS